MIPHSEFPIDHEYTTKQFARTLNSSAFAYGCSAIKHLG